jgi:hypothetical protein
VPGRNATYLKLEKTRFLFRESSYAAAAEPPAATVTLANAPAALAGASVARAVSSTDCPTVGTSVPAAGIFSSTASAALDDGGGGFHLSGGARPLSLSSSSSSSDDEISRVAGGESPCCLRSRYSSLYCSRRSHRRILLSFLCAARSYSRRCATRATARARGVSELDREASTITLY